MLYDLAPALALLALHVAVSVVFVKAVSARLRRDQAARERLARQSAQRAVEFSGQSAQRERLLGMESAIRRTDLRVVEVGLTHLRECENG